MFNIIAEDNKRISRPVGPTHNIIIYTIKHRIVLQLHLATAAAVDAEQHRKSKAYKYSTIEESLAVHCCLV